MVKKAVQQGQLDWNVGEEINGKTVFQHSEEQPELKAIIKKWVDYVASGIVTLVHIFNPEKIIIGGGICREQDKFIVPLRLKVLTDIMPAFAEGLEIIPAKLGNDAGMVGAVFYNIYGGKK
jgi:glucokinase